MVEKVEKSIMNNILSSENTCNAKEKFDDYEFVDNKVFVCETAVITDNVELPDHARNTIKQEPALDDIKIELSLPEIQSNTLNESVDVKVEEGISAHNIKSEFNNEPLFCDHCLLYYQDYCIECGMLVHILNRNVLKNTDNTRWDELPNDILEIQNSVGQFGVFASRVIPKDVRFGPFTGLSFLGSKRKLKGGRFIVSRIKSKYLNWMQCINPARTVSEQNLHPFQYEGNLYYRSTRKIETGEELFVYFGEDYEESLNKDIEMNFTPDTEECIKEVFACTFCCLGFSSSAYLAQHKTICLNDADGNFSIGDLIQCSYCSVYLGEAEYNKYHMAYCSKRNVRKFIRPTSNRSTTEERRGRPQRPHMYKCTQCKYKTAYKGLLKRHSQQHFEVKLYKCGICSRRFKMKGHLKMHVQRKHVNVDREDPRKYSTNTYIKADAEAIQSAHRDSKDEVKQFECSKCGCRTKTKFILTRHIKTQHLKEFDHKCEICAYKTNNKLYFEIHLKTKHLKEFNYKCEMCEYKTNWKQEFDNHIRSKHLKVFDHKCNMCDFKTHWKKSLKHHMRSKHFKEHKCRMCEYETNQKINLEIHIKKIHLNELDYKCTSCEYKCSTEASLKVHIKTNHLKEFVYKCAECEYTCSTETNLNIHIKTKHLKEFRFKCELCKYETNYKQSLNIHIKTQHLKKFDYKCEFCTFETNHKSGLDVHRKSIHLKEFRYKCRSCDYETNGQNILEKHVKTVHLKEFHYTCDICEFKTNSKRDLERHKKSKFRHI